MTDWPFDPLILMKYGAILADPPWSYAMWSESGYEKSPEAHYQTMPLSEIKELPVRDLAGPDCYLFLWSTWPHLEQAMSVMTAWGFAYVSGGSWTKRTKNWGVGFGTGYVMRSASEPFLVGKIGRPQVASRSERNVIVAPEEIPGSISASCSRVKAGMDMTSGATRPTALRLQMGKRNIPVTDHAVLRWLERVAMVDIETVRRQIYSETREALNSGAERVTVNGTDYRMRGGVVTTVASGRRKVRPLSWPEEQ